jgi:hypothetical protein
MSSAGADLCNSVRPKLKDHVGTFNTQSAVGIQPRKNATAAKLEPRTGWDVQFLYVFFACLGGSSPLKQPQKKSFVWMDEPSDPR